MGRPACYAVIQLAEELRVKVGDKDFRDQISLELKSLVDDVNRQVETYEQIQFLAIAKDEWTISNDFLTPTQKIKRSIIESTYSPYLDDWYASGQKVRWQD